MPRKPNYGFERNERARLKAEKKAKRAQEKQEARDMKSGTAESTAKDGGDDAPLGSGE